MATKIQVVLGKPACPNCGSDDLMHAYDVSYRGHLVVSPEGEVCAAYHRADAETHSERILCLNCNWCEDDDCDVEIIEPDRVDR